MAHALLLHNPAARSSPGPALLAAILRAFERRGFTCEEAASKAPGDMRSLARRAPGKGFDRVVVCGGDGSVREAATGLAGSSVPLAVVPLGTANVLARELDLPRRPLACVALAASGREKRVGLGTLGEDEAFTFCASCGLDSMAVASVDLKMKSQTGAWAYIHAGLMRLLSGETCPLTLETDAGATATGGQIFAARGSLYGSPLLRLSRDQNIGLDTTRFFVVSGSSAAGLTTTLVALLRGGLEGARGIEIFDARAALVTSGESLPVQADGDLVAATPVEISTLPDALTLIVP